MHGNGEKRRELTPFLGRFDGAGCGRRDHASFASAFSAEVLINSSVIDAH
jgi:hypothetical protein